MVMLVTEIIFLVHIEKISRPTPLMQKYLFSKLLAETP